MLADVACCSKQFTTYNREVGRRCKLLLVSGWTNQECTMRIFDFLFLPILCVATGVALATTDSVRLFESHEILVSLSQTGISNVWDFPVNVVFTSPSQRTVTTGGFYHSKDMWMVRVAPDEVGED